MSNDSLPVTPVVMSRSPIPDAADLLRLYLEWEFADRAADMATDAERQRAAELAESVAANRLRAALACASGHFREIGFMRSNGRAVVVRAGLIHWTTPFREGVILVPPPLLPPAPPVDPDAEVKACFARWQAAREVARQEINGPPAAAALAEVAAAEAALYVAAAKLAGQVVVVADKGVYVVLPNSIMLVCVFGDSRVVNAMRAAEGGAR